MTEFFVIAHITVWARLRDFAGLKGVVKVSWGTPCETFIERLPYRQALKFCQKLQFLAENVPSDEEGTLSAVESGWEFTTYDGRRWYGRARVLTGWHTSQELLELLLAEEELWRSRWE